MKAALYLRVSTRADKRDNDDAQQRKRQDIENQRRFEVLLFRALDRFSREGVLETLNYLQRLNSFGVNWRSHTEQYLDSCGVFREAVLAILAVIAKQERIRGGRP
jgi:DNA invertase Pin-like site-specific DNA recombinase